MQSPSAPTSARLQFLDLFRGVFILIMVEGHTLRALLDPAIRQTAAFQLHELIHNLTGPAFLFASGASFVYSTQAQWENYRRWGPKLRRRLLRWLGVLAVGYGLQLSYRSLWRTLRDSTPEQFAFLAGLNILQCICLGLVLLQIVAMSVRDWRRFFWVAVLGTVAIGMATSFAWDAGSRWPVWLGSLVSGRTRSIFPLLPYAGFSFAGAAWGYLHALARKQEGERQFLVRCTGLCALLSVVSVALSFLPLPEIYSDFWYTSPLFLFLRVGILGMIAAGLRWPDPSPLLGTPPAEVPTREPGRGLRLLAVTGRESLMIYVVHLLVLYGSAFNPDTSLVKLLGTKQSLGGALLILALFASAMVLLGVWWDSWKRARDWRVQGVKWLLGGYLGYTFLIG
jgi:uncharacterized membrane protein